MRHFSRWLLKRRRAMCLEELEEGIRKHDAFTVYRYTRLLAGTGIGSKHRRIGQVRAYTPSQIECASGLAKEGPKGGLALHEYTWNDFRREHLELQDPGDSATTTWHREEARADYARTVKQLRRAPARRSCPIHPGQYQAVFGCFSCGRPSSARENDKLMHWVTSRLQARNYWKPDTPSLIAWKQHDGAMRRLLSAVALLDGSSQNQVRWALSRVAWYTACVIFGRRGTVDFSGGNVARITVVLLWIPTSTSEGGGSGFTPGTALAARCRHESISFLTKVWTWQTPSVRWTEKTRKT